MGIEWVEIVTPSGKFSSVGSFCIDMFNKNLPRLGTPNCNQYP
jgi:hypothetical protein